MKNVEIFRAGVGEGKTKWLVEKAIEASKEPCVIYYVGSKKGLFKVVEMWMSETKTLCPIKSVYDGYKPGYSCPYYFLTDELIENMELVGFWWRTAQESNATWYMTMGKEDFIN